MSRQHQLSANSKQQAGVEKATHSNSKWNSTANRQTGIERGARQQQPASANSKLANSTASAIGKLASRTGAQQQQQHPQTATLGSKETPSNSIRNRKKLASRTGAHNSIRNSGVEERTRIGIGKNWRQRRDATAIGKSTKSPNRTTRKYSIQRRSTVTIDDWSTSGTPVFLELRRAGQRR